MNNNMETQDQPISDDTTTNQTTTKTKNKKDPRSRASNLQGMALVNEVCKPRKKIFDTCVSQWYHNEFLVGKSLSQDDACGEKHELYKKCILKGIRKEIWEKQYQLPPPDETSPLSEVE